MSTAAVAQALETDTPARRRPTTPGAPELTPPAPSADPGRPSHRPRIAGTTTERLPVRACSGEDLGRHLQPRVAAARRGDVRHLTVAEAEPPALRLTRRGRALLTAVSVLVFGAAIAVLGLRVAGVLEPEPQFTRTIQVEVGPGQTLWSIAQDTNPTDNPASVVEQIANLNNLDNAADVTPGQTLQVPVR
jgi:hypothetical protein